MGTRISCVTCHSCGHAESAVLYTKHDDAEDPVDADLSGVASARRNAQKHLPWSPRQLGPEEEPASFADIVVKKSPGDNEALISLMGSNFAGEGRALAVDFQDGVVQVPPTVPERSAHFEEVSSRLFLEAEAKRKEEEDDEREAKLEAERQQILEWTQKAAEGEEARQELEEAGGQEEDNTPEVEISADRARRLSEAEERRHSRISVNGHTVGEKEIPSRQAPPRVGASMCCGCISPKPKDPGRCARGSRAPISLGAGGEQISLEEYLKKKQEQQLGATPSGGFAC